MSKIRFATPRDMKAIRHIWSAVFTDDVPQERDRFLKMVRLSDACMLACVDGKPVSMGFFIPAKLRVDGSEYTVRYLYAAATLPAHRGKGIFSDLLKTAISIFKERGENGCFLNPAEPTLVEYYSRFDFKPAFFCHTIEGIARVAQLPMTPLSASEFYALRKTLLPHDRIEWDEYLLRYAASYATPMRIGDGACALFVKQEDTLCVLELLGVPANQQPTVCSALAWHQGCHVFNARVFSKSGECFGMFLPFSEDIPLDRVLYMGLAFD